MTAYLLDTHVWFWYLTGSERLPNGIRSVLDQQREDCLLSPISIWEVGILSERGRIELDVPFGDWVELAQEKFPVREAPVTAPIAAMSIEVDLPHPDPADRFIAATAAAWQATLLTVDRRLLNAGWLATFAG